MFRGAGGKAFIAGTDIAQFRSFTSGEDGIAYEKKMEGYVSGLETLPMPTLAVVEGFAIGGGPRHRHGLRPAHRHTRGEFWPADRAHARQLRVDGQLCAPRCGVRHLAREEDAAARRDLECRGGVGRRLPHRDRAARKTLDARIAELCDRLAHHAPITMRVSKEAIRRLLGAGLPDGDDLVRACFGSEDFRTGVNAFLEKKEPQWRGR